MIDDYEMWVDWSDPRSAEIYGSELGPFRLVHIKKEKSVPPCTCGGGGGGLLDDGHSYSCGIRGETIIGSFAIVEMNGRHRSFPIELFNPIPRLRRKQ